MDAIPVTAARRTRALAVAAVLLCAFAVFAPVLARQAGSHHPRINAVRVVNVSGADHSAGSTRLDQPLVATLPVHAATSTVPVVARAEHPDRSPDTTTSTPSTRGPPVRS